MKCGFFKAEKFIPEPFYLQWYKWTTNYWFTELATTFIQFHGWIICLNLNKNKIKPIIFDLHRWQESCSMFPYPAPKHILKYVKIWLDSGMFQSVKLTDFLEETMSDEDKRGSNI
jgi:hypothetical protein